MKQRYRNRKKTMVGEQNLEEGVVAERQEDKGSRSNRASR